MSVACPRLSSPGDGCPHIAFPSVPAGAYKGGGRGEAGRARRCPPPAAGPMQPAMMMFSSKYWARRGFSLDSALPEERPAAGSFTVSAGAGAGRASRRGLGSARARCRAAVRPLCSSLRGQSAVSQQLQGPVKLTSLSNRSPFKTLP